MPPKTQKPAPAKAGKNYRPKKLLLVYNPQAGEAKANTSSLEEVVGLLQSYRFDPQVFLLRPDSDLADRVKQALADGIALFVACGGDGTSSSLARLLVGSQASLGIIPNGTQNNMPLALDIPADPAEAVKVLREGRTLKIDVGRAKVGSRSTYFMEVFSVGLVSSLFPPADGLQHGNLQALGELVKTFTLEKPASFEIRLSSRKDPIRSQGLVLLAVNMPVIGLNYRLGKRSAMQDGKLDLIFFEDANKLDLLSYVARGLRDGLPEARKIKKILAEKISIKVDPPMTLMYDGEVFGEGNVELSVLKHAISVMIPKKSRVRQTG